MSNKTKVMIVEDEWITSNDLKESLENIGYTVCSQTDTGEEAVKKSESDSPDVVLMDIMLPGKMDGIEAAKIIHDRFHIPVIYLTAHADERILQQAKTSEPFGYLLKPFEIKEVRTAIEVATYKSRAEKALRESHQVLLTILDGLDALVYAVDMETYEILFANKYLRDEFGDLTGKVCWEAIQKGQTGPCEFCSSNTLLDSENQPNGSYSGELENTRNGKCYLIRDRAIPWVDGHLVRLKVAQDITQRKKMEEEFLKAKEKAEQATKLKDKFVSLVAHDLRGPLGTLLGFIKMFRHPFTLQKKERIISSAIRTAEKMVTLIEELLCVSRLKTGEIRPNFVFLDAFWLVSYSIPNQSFLAEKKGITIKNLVPRYTRIYADPTLFGEVIINLVSNAIKFCKAGDTITIYIPDGHPSTVAVSDTGKGINPQLITSLFDYENKTTTIGTDGETGTGLGLPLSRDIMEAHQGRLFVESVPNEGTTFYAELPPVKPIIMIVDDDPPTRMLLINSMQSLKVDIVEANDGAEALKLMKDSKPHLILSDIYMPNMDGFDLLEAIRKDESLKKIPFILLTVDTGIEAGAKAFHLGADDVIAKPITVEELILRVGKHISKSEFWIGDSSKNMK